jgi:hypothetical protein
MAVVAYDDAIFKARYPEFAAVSSTLLSACFNDAGLYLSNTDGSPVSDTERRRQLLNMLTAHIAVLGGALTPGGGAEPVGRVSSATEGAVSAQFDYGQMTDNNGAWFKQTAYGAQFWQATSSLRGFRYMQRRTTWR